MITKWHDDQLFANINYSGAKIVQTEFNQCTFSQCDFSNADLSESELVNCIFRNCNLSNVKLKGTGIKEVNFFDSKLMGMGFDASSDFLFSVSFQNCILDYSVFAGKKMKDTQFIQCSLKEVDFSGTDLSMADFHNCNLLQAVFNRTNLEKADFRTASDFSIDPEINKIKKAKFSLDGISGLLHKYNIVIE